MRGGLGPSLEIRRDARGLHVTTPAGFILATGHSRWREGALCKTMKQVAAAHRILLHEQLEATAWYCPATGLQLAVDFHEKGKPALHDVIVELESLVQRSEP